LREIAAGGVRFNEGVEPTIRAYLAEVKNRNMPRFDRRG